MCSQIRVSESKLQLTIAGYGEQSSIHFVSLVKDSDQRNVEDHTLHQHPHERDQKPVVEKNSHKSASNRNSTHLSPLPHIRLDSSHEYDLSNAQCDTELDMDVVSHLVHGPLD